MSPRAVGDRFDHPPRIGRVGMHRKPEQRWWKWWMTLIVAAAAAVVLTAAGLAWLSALRGEQIDLPTLPGASQAAPVTDPSTIDPAAGITITVLDASSHDGTGAAVHDRLRAAGWPVVAVARADQGSEATTVYYSDPSQEGVARGIVDALGMGDVAPAQTPISGSPITVVVGADATASQTPSPSNG